MPSVIPLIPIDLDRRRHLRFDYRAVKTAERELSDFWARDYPFFEALQRLLDFMTTGDLAKLSMANLGILLWQGCCHEDRALALDTIEESLPHIGDMPGLMLLVTKIFEAWQAGSKPLATDHEVDAVSNPLDGSSGASAGPLLVSTSA